MNSETGSATAAICSVFVACVVDTLNRLYYVGVAKTRVRVTPRVGVWGEGKGVFKGKGEGEFKERVKACGNITVAMIMQLSFIRYSYWFTDKNQNRSID